ncbi:MucBP domain-containing protein [Streptococcus constellatus]|uniref:SpaA isopeptide-forming pilin-related protein n=1 Tax=Streptococcus constellatus TaxID=76860 RepID=UPI0018E17336|nr:SpaA isopeptide-forming pilin-related protein [Streptococcus constellatus]QQC22491.1 MucBP domain-containing protein [Streptococcus constellatus]
MKKRGNIQKLILFFWFLLYLGGNIYYTQDVFASNNNTSNSVTNKTSKVDDFKKAYEDGFYNTNYDWSVTENFYSKYIPNDIKAYNKATTNVSDVKISVEFKEKENNKGIAYLTDNKKRHSDNKATDNLFIGKLDTNKTPTLGIFTQAGEDEGKLNTSERWNFEGSKFVGTLTITFDKEVENPILDLSGIGGYRKVFTTGSDNYAKGSFSASELELKNADITVEKVGTGANLQVENKKIKVIDKNTYSQSVLDKPFVQDAENPTARTPNLSPAGTGSVMLVGKMKEVTFDVYHSAIPFSKFSKEQYHTGEPYFKKEEDKKCADGINGLNTLITEEVCKDKFNDKGTKLYNSDLFLISIRLAKRGSVDVKYITTDGKILENVTDVVKDELVGKDYITVQKSFNGYVFEKMDTNSAPTTGKVKEEKQHVIYVYREHIPGFPPPSTKVKFSKKALTENGEELKGATIRLTKEDGSLVEEWVTDGTVKEFELKDGKYTFTEISAPAKYQVATAITFEVKNGKAIVKGIEVTGNTIVMVDKLKELPPPPSTPPTKVKFSKKALTENGEELKGATIRLTKEDGSLVEEWVTDGTVKEFELKDGKYTFTEISAPAKYQVATAITFEVKNGKAIVKGIEVTGNTIVMVDKLKELPPPNTNTNKTLPKTGEGTNISLYAWLMLTSGTLLVLIGYRRRNHAE